MNLTTTFLRNRLFVILATLSMTPAIFSQQPKPHARLINPAAAEINLPDNRHTIVDFYGENIFRLFSDPSGGILRDPSANPPAQILTDNPRKPVAPLALNVADDTISILSAQVRIDIDTKTGQLKISDLQRGKTVVQGLAPPVIRKNHAEITLKTSPSEYFYGGGMQNGRFSHKGKTIQIVNTNNWVDGGVASPTPFYWSTNGYGILWHTFRPGQYDFGSRNSGEVKLFHEESYLDLFFMVGETPVQLLNAFYQLTGNPVLLPKFGFYEGHLNAYNRDYWKPAEKEGEGTLFEDGKRYTESQKDNGGTKESLNGEKNNYQFSARGVIDRYRAHDMPLGWLLPNDGYGAGYGQTGSLDGNIQNLKELGGYARKHGVEIGLWTQSDLHPKEGVEPLLQRDIIREVSEAGVRVLKTDVAWVGAGYSFGLNGVADVAHIMPYYGNDARPFIITLDGWAGTQRYASLWSGDQTGGKWEYIRFHIPTYIGSGLSGQPNVSSDMDGIFGGNHVPVNVRDFQWKTFTPMQLNMDGWGATPKYPHILGEPAASINRLYLKLKSQLIPYTYSTAHEAIDGKPIVRAMFLDDPNGYTLGKATQYQFLYGSDFLVAPIYRETSADADGNDIRNGIYLPQGTWIDYFSGECYEGGRVINNFDAPLWKLPVFVKAGAIIPMANANNNVAEIDKTRRIYEVYPSGKSSFTEYDDDGVSEAYRSGRAAQTTISSDVQKNKAIVTIGTTSGSFNGFVKNKSTEFRINVTAKPKKVEAKIGAKKMKLTEAKSLPEFESRTNVYFYDATPNLNRFATKGSVFETVKIEKNPVVLVKLEETDITSHGISLTVEGYVFSPADKLLKSTGLLTAPQVSMPEENIEAYSITPAWEKAANADYYEIEFGGMLYSTIKTNRLMLEDLTPETDYTLSVRAVNKEGQSDWTTVSVRTKNNPLEFAIKGIRAQTSCENQRGQGINKLFNFDEGDMWHTAWGDKGSAVPFDILIDLRSTNQLDKLEYLPRESGANGILMQGSISTSDDNERWTAAGSFAWDSNSETKQFSFATKPTARYVKISVEKAVGDYGSGREMYIFKVPGSETLYPGDINRDGKVDMDDFTSYMNYTGLKKGDSDFDGYVSGGDVNRNGIIDAFDISVVATQIDGGADGYGSSKVGGALTLTPNKTTFKTGDEIEIVVSAQDLRSVNALGFALPYNPQELEFVAVKPIATKEMENLTNDRLHTDGSKVLYPTFINIGDKETLEGSGHLFTLTFKAKRDGKLQLHVTNGILVDKNLNWAGF